MTSIQLILTTLRSGVMRITVTVVVIMFELTGALTYILPTMVRIFVVLDVNMNDSICAIDRSLSDQSRR